MFTCTCSFDQKSNSEGEFCIDSNIYPVKKTTIRQHELPVTFTFTNSLNKYSQRSRLLVKFNKTSELFKRRKWLGVWHFNERAIELRVDYAEMYSKRMYCIPKIIY